MQPIREITTSTHFRQVRSQTIVVVFQAFPLINSQVMAPLADAPTEMAEHWTACSPSDEGVRVSFFVFWFIDCVHSIDNRHFVFFPFSGGANVL